MQNFSVKLHENFAGSKVLAISDPDIVGKFLEDSDRGLQFNVSEVFYGGDMINDEEVLRMIKASDNVNAIGTKIVDTMIEAKLVDPKNVITIMGVKHAQIYSLK